MQAYRSSQPHAHVYVYTCIYACVCIYIYIYVYILGCMCAHAYIRKSCILARSLSTCKLRSCSLSLCVSLYVCTHLSAPVYMSMHIYLYFSLRLCIYTSTYMYLKNMHACVARTPHVSNKKPSSCRLPGYAAFSPGPPLPARRARGWHPFPEAAPDFAKGPNPTVAERSHTLPWADTTVFLWCFLLVKDIKIVGNLPKSAMAAEGSIQVYETVATRGSRQ